MRIPSKELRDFRRVYRSLCKKYGVKPDSMYAGEVEE